MFTSPSFYGEQEKFVLIKSPVELEAMTLRLLEEPTPQRLLTDHCTILDTLALARQLHPGQRNSLDALCKRYGVDNSNRDLHGALLDARILADVYLAMTGGQGALTLHSAGGSGGEGSKTQSRRRVSVVEIPIIRATAEELAAHETALDLLQKASGGKCLFRAAAAPTLA